MTPSVGSRPLCNPVARISRYICLRKPTSSPRPFRTDGLDKKERYSEKSMTAGKFFVPLLRLRENRTMKIREEYKVREMAGEHVVIMQGRLGVDMTKIISLNESALYLWNALAGKEFSVDDAARLLTERYEVDDATAARDAAAWVEKLRDCKLI